MGAIPYQFEPEVFIPEGETPPDSAGDISQLKPPSRFRNHGVVSGVGLIGAFGS